MNIAAVALFDCTGRIILQLRDDSIGIENRGKIGLFGGAVHGEETAVFAAVRELYEELGINISPELLTPLFVADKVEDSGRTVSVHVFRLDFVETDRLILMEGCAIVLASPKAISASQQLTSFTRMAINWIIDN
jgi:8-oxo-dGTP pyrophosphatase MutT (NUDIX family)